MHVASGGQVIAVVISGMRLCHYGICSSGEKDEETDEKNRKQCGIYRCKTTKSNEQR